MNNALLSDVEARAERRRTRTSEGQAQEHLDTAWNTYKSAPTPADARRWLERASRLAPHDGTIAITLASVWMDHGEHAAARRLFQSVADQHGIPEAWAGLATCAHLLKDAAAARDALRRLLHTSLVTPTVRALGDAIAGPEGWCGLLAGPTLHTSQPAAASPANWADAAAIDVQGPHGPMLGSPLPLRALTALEGFAEAVAGGIEGWVWQPADPDATIRVHATGPHGQAVLEITEPAPGLRLARPLGRPRLLRLSAGEVAGLGEPVSLHAPDGRPLLGSPLRPGLEARAAAGAPGFHPVWADTVGSSPAVARRPAPVDIVIPVYRGAEETLACLHSVHASALPRGTRIIVVDDASPDAPLAAALDTLARQRRIRLVRLPVNRGFPGAANAGMQEAAGRDVVLLNSDTLVPPGWLTRLRAAAYAAPDIGTATPLTNDGTILNYPDPAGGNPIPTLAETTALDELAQAANAGQTADLPVGVGFCLYVRRDCLDQAGPLREDLFAQGYGEENDLCLRARHRGWRNVAALDVFVAHVGAVSFGAARAHLIRRNGTILERLHPGYDALVARHQAADPLRPARARMDTLRWAAARNRAGAVVLVTHAGGGGVERVVRAAVAAVAAAGQRPILLRPHPGGVRIDAKDTPNLVFPMPEGLPGLARFLRPDRVRRVEVHHLLGHHHAIAGLAALLKAEAVSVVHDYARFCPRIALVGIDRRYCGEPDVAGCEACVADLGSLLEDDPPLAVLLQRSAAELQAATRIVAPSADAASRIARHFPGVEVQPTPWEDDAAWPPLAPPLARPLAPAPGSGPLRIAVIGAIGREKGYDALLGCVRDAKARALPLEFVVVGFTMDDERLMAAGPAFVTGQYAEADGASLIRAQNAQAALIPSIWPETWCFALSRAWEAGLPAFVFDLGAQAARTRATGRGWTLPLALPPRAVNDALLRLAPGAAPSLRLAPGAPPSQCPPDSP